ncbi:MAG: TonB family protein [Candidatus Sulfotelmatobacter sp.]|nr:TonB family protein [Candidatus Sulfotelmatobacter sp.]
MGYQALLFCPDEKTARSVTQVLSELDFAVTPCTEPFAAVKKLMGEHFDAVVVDCDNEQNATLLFKSARNTGANQSSLAVAVVEGQAGVAKAFRIGANLVLTKPINLEQAKGTLRVARGLLRKNEVPKTAPAPTKPDATASAEPSRNAIPSVDVSYPKVPTFPLTAPERSNVTAQGSTSVPAADPIDIVATRDESVEGRSKQSASPKIAEPAPAKPYVPESAPSRAGFGQGSASAPAPARDPKAVAEDTPSKVSPRSEVSEKAADLKGNAASTYGTSAPAPTFTFGGTIGSDTESTGAGTKKILLAVAAAIVLIAVGSYLAWMHWGQSKDNTSVPVPAIESPVKTTAAIPQVPKPAPSAQVSAPDFSTSATPEKAPAHSSKVTTTESSKPSPSSVAENKAPENKAPATKEEAEPIVIKNNPSRSGTKSSATNEAPALSLTGIAPAGNGGGLPNLIDSQSKAPTPVLQTLSVSQGVSQGLLVKKVQPKYPANALRLRVEGGVQLMATISKNGDISTVSVLHGDPQLSHAAVDAVKQWKYKPYLLNGEPVEIQTQITVNFKLPK